MSTTEVKAPQGWSLLKNGKGCITGQIKLSYPRLWELDPTAEINPDKYTTNIILTEEEKNWIIQTVVQNTYNDAVATYQKWGGKKPNNFQMPNFKELEQDEAKLFYPNATGKYYSIIVKTSERPKLIDLQTKPLQNADDIYSGVIVRMSITAFPWVYAGKAGISFSCGVVQKLADAPRIGGSQASDITMFESLDGVDLSGLGGDPFAIAQQQADPFTIAQQQQQQQQPAQSVAAGSNDTDLLMPMQQTQQFAQNQSANDKPLLF